MSEKKSILVTGCTSGIGYATAKYLNENGYQVLLSARNKERLEKVSEELDNSKYIVCDFLESDQIEALFRTCKEWQIKLDGMVHCAGSYSSLPIKMFKESDMKEQMQLHYFSFMELCKGFYDKNVSNKEASVVGISSYATHTQYIGSSQYSASMSALNTAVNIASKEFIKRNIRVNAVMPAYVQTRMLGDLEQYAGIEEKQPMGLIPPTAIAQVIEFLISDKSKYITGVCIPISGGMA